MPIASNSNPSRLAARRFTWVLALLAGGCAGNQDWSPTVQDSAAGLMAHAAPGADSVAEGFRGDTHPLLAEGATLEVEAHWTPVGRGRAFKSGFFPLEFYEPFRQLAVAQARRKYSARHFSAFLPPGDSLATVGETWSLDLAGVSQFLTQFHPAVSMHVDSTGRLAGPNGGFAILRAVSPTHAEIAFRIHAEIEPEPGVYFTPAHFSGTLLIDKQAGTVERFQLSIPTDEVLNATLTVALPTEALLDIVHVDRMELVSLNRNADGIDWADAITMTEVQERLKQSFYGFMEIDWVPPEEAIAMAEENEKPIFAVVLWGGLDEQSC